ncbi:MAG: SDR family oxidoreductase [Wolbachia endosymbiont of Tyrophagus putrescentiae]|nr:SDR family oxidoreductase [Wolbachia endosymbiont of Tyrophagus putrescentiae]
MSNKLLEGKVALITGASSAMGSAIAKKFINEGAHVILISRSIDNLNILYNEIIEEFKELKENSIILIQLDLLDFENVTLLANKITNLKLSESGALDILVGCAEALGELSPTQDYDLGAVQNIMDTNFTANWYLLKNLDPILKKSDAGRIIFLTSEATLSPSSYPYHGIYAASKAALETMVKIYASETKHTKLCVNAVYLESATDNKKTLSENDVTELINKFVELASANCSTSGEVRALVN